MENLYLILIFITLIAGYYVFHSLQINSIHKKINHMYCEQEYGGLLAHNAIEKLPQNCCLHENEVALYKAIVKETIEITTKRFIKNDTHSGQALHQNTLYRQMDSESFFYYSLLNTVSNYLDKNIAYINNKSYSIYEYLGKDSEDNRKKYRYTKEGFIIRKIYCACTHMLKDVTYRDEKFSKKKLIVQIAELEPQNSVWKI